MVKVLAILFIILFNCSIFFDRIQCIHQGDFGEGIHEEKKYEEVLDELAEVADEEKERINELEDENEKLKENMDSEDDEGEDQANGNSGDGQSLSDDEIGGTPPIEDGREGQRDGRRRPLPRQVNIKQTVKGDNGMISLRFK